MLIEIFIHTRHNHPYICTSALIFIGTQAEEPVMHLAAISEHAASVM